MLCSSFALHGVHGASVNCSGWCWIRIWLEIWLLCWCVGTAKANLDIQFSGLIQSKSSFSNSLVCTKDQLLLGRAGVRLFFWHFSALNYVAADCQGRHHSIPASRFTAAQPGGVSSWDARCFRGQPWESKLVFWVVFLLECMLIWSVLSDCDEIIVRTKLQCENAKLIAFSSAMRSEK